MSRLDAWTDQALQLAAEFERSHDTFHLDRAVDLFTRVVTAGDDADPDHARHLDNLAVSLLTRFEATADRMDLQAALAYSRAATADRLTPHPDHALHLSNLSNTALAWFDEMQDSPVLDEAVNAGAKAVSLGREGDDLDLYRAAYKAARVRRFEQDILSCQAYMEHFERDGSQEQLGAAVSVGRAAISDAPADEPRRWVAWSNLSHVLRVRYELLGADDDLGESIRVARRASRLAKDGGVAVPGQPFPLSSCAVNLSAALLARFLAGGTTADADEVIAICRRMKSRPDISARDSLLVLSNLVGALQGRADRNDDNGEAQADLDEAANAARELVKRARRDEKGVYLANLANALLACADRSGTTDVAEALGFADEAARLLPLGTQEWARAAANRATALSRRWRLSRDPSDAESAADQWLAIVRSPTVGTSIRVAAGRDAAALAVDSGRGDVGLVAAAAAVELLPLLAWRGLAWRSRARQLVRWPLLAVDAAAIALICAEREEAVVLTEHGRAVLWVQLLDLRSDVDALRDSAPALAQRLSTVQAQLSR